MPNYIGPSVPGARAAKELLLNVERAARRAIDATGEIDPVTIAALLQIALSDTSMQPGMLLALAEVIGMACLGSPIDAHEWNPLKYFTASERDANSSTFLQVPVKRF